MNLQKREKIISQTVACKGGQCIERKEFVFCAEGTE